MAIKQVLEIKDRTMDEEYVIVGRQGVYCKEDYKKTNDYFLLNKDKTERFILVDLYQLGVFGSENCHQTYDENEELNIVTEEDINKYTEDVIKHINNGLFDTIKEAIIEEIEADEQETIKLVR